MPDAKSSLISRLRSQNDLIPFLGLLYQTLIIVIFMVLVVVSIGSVPPFVYFYLPFIVLFGISAFGVMRHSRWGYLLAVASTGIGLLLFSDGGHGVEFFATPSNTLAFSFAILHLPALFMIFIYSVFGLRRIWSKAAVPKPDVMIPRSYVLGLLTIGLVLGGLMVGLMAGVTLSNAIANAGKSADITIVSTTVGFSPATFTTTVGHVVTWVNKDSITHTVTNTNSSKVFDSGNLTPGNTFSWTFTAPGTYTYYCAIHPEMTGKVVVT